MAGAIARAVNSGSRGRSSTSHRRVVEPVTCDRHAGRGRIPLGGEVRRMSARRIVRLLALVAASCLLVSPAAAAPKRTDATLRVAEGYYPYTGSQPYTYASEPCAVRLKTLSATAHDVLIAAHAAGCVSSYELVEDPSYGSYVRCVEGRCESTGFYWAIYVNATLACEGIDGIAVGPGDEVTFSYEAYPTALLLATC